MLVHKETVLPTKIHHFLRGQDVGVPRGELKKRVHKLQKRERERLSRVLNAEMVEP